MYCLTRFFVRPETTNDCILFLFFFILRTPDVQYKKPSITRINIVEMEDPNPQRSLTPNDSAAQEVQVSEQKKATNSNEIVDGVQTGEKVL